MEEPEISADTCANDPSRGPYRPDGRATAYVLNFDQAGIADAETGSDVVVHIEVANPSIGKIKNVVDDRQQMRA